MKCIIAADSFKGSGSSLAVCSDIRDGMNRVYPDAQYEIIPVADGGEGTVDAVITAGEGTRQTLTVTGPLAEPVEAFWGLLPGAKAVIEMASASGLPLVPGDKKDPMKTTTYGTGELIRAALDAGSREILIGVGGSATNDCGVGMAQALGGKFLDEHGKEIGFGGGELSKLAHIDLSGLDERIREAHISVACDVTNPLCGPDGASAVYGPQKGADAQMVEVLDANLLHCSKVIERDLGIPIADIPGSGAAGGLGGGLVGFLGAELVGGIDAVLTLLEFDKMLEGVDLVITGEGKLDHQTAFGKVPAGVATWAKKTAGIPVVAIVGDIGEGFEAVYEIGIDVVISTVNKAMPLEEAMQRSSELLVETGERVARLLRIGASL
jgi:glycerate kinase